MPTLSSKLRIDDWAESTLEDLGEGRRTTRAEVRLRDGADGIASGSFGMLAYYLPDGTGHYVTLAHLTGSLDGRAGSFALSGAGEFAGGIATGRMTIVAGSGTGELAGISGTWLSESTHDDYPFMPFTLTYQLA